ncbi:MAG: hypothetical protein MRZ79_17055 [Bacteroidia bacterium]|nr:hypothetical protein [Bacteroidia bacterium]
MNFPKVLIFSFLLGGLLSLPLFSQAQKMEMNAANEEAKTEMRNALNIMGHDMPKYAQHVMKAYELDPNMPMAMCFMTVLTQADKKKSMEMAKKFTDYEGELNDGEQVFSTMMSHWGDTTYIASNDAKELLELYPEDAGLHVLLGFIFMDDKMTDKAIAAFDKAIELDDLPGAYNMKAFAYMDKGEMDNAKSSLEAYIKRMPNHPNPYDSMGDFYMAQKDYKNAYEQYTKASSMEGAFPESAEKAKKAKELMEP